MPGRHATGKKPRSKPKVKSKSLLHPFRASRKCSGGRTLRSCKRIAHKRRSRPAIVADVRAIPIQRFGDEPGRQTRKFVLLVLATHADSDGGNCFPGMDTLAAEAGLTPRGLRKVVRWLEANNWLKVARNESRLRTNLFRIILPSDPELQSSPSTSPAIPELQSSPCQSSNEELQSSPKPGTPEFPQPTNTYQENTNGPLLAEKNSRNNGSRINCGEFVRWLNAKTESDYDPTNPGLQKKVLRQFERLLRKHDGNADRAKEELSDAVRGFESSDFYMARGKHSSKQRHSPTKAILDSLDTCEELAMEWRRQ